MADSLGKEDFILPHLFSDEEIARRTGVTLEGGDGDDTLTGGNQNDVLSGGGGNDTLWGRGSEDTLNGDAGDDRLHGGSGDDLMRGGDGDDLLYGNSYEDRLYGENGEDRLYGGSGRDRLYGGDGDDMLSGGEGDDTLSGGKGNDTFRFFPGGGTDTITDFKTGDKIEIFNYPGGFDSFDLLDIQQVGDDTLIEVFSDTWVRLSGVSADSLSENDFVFADRPDGESGLQFDGLRQGVVLEVDDTYAPGSGQGLLEALTAMTF